jgi:hypothetical protein
MTATVEMVSASKPEPDSKQHGDVAPLNVVSRVVTAPSEGVHNVHLEPSQRQVKMKRSSQVVIICLVILCNLMQVRFGRLQNSSSFAYST